MQMNRPLMAIVLGSLAGACASSGHTRIEASALPACMNRPELDGWHQVAGDGLTFCVPADWSSTGGHAWHGSGGRIRWAPGATPFRVESRFVAVAVPKGQVPPSAPKPTLRLVYNTSELVDHAQVDLWIFEKDGSFDTGASWNTGERMHMTGEAPSRAAADVHMDIFRSVRIEAPTQPD
jgi:hypothetical protein